MGFLYDDSDDEIDNYDPEDLIDSISEDEYDEIKKQYDKESKITKNKSKWTNDNDGVKVSYLLVEPLIKKIIKQLKKKCREYNKEFKKNPRIPTKKEIERFEILANMLKEIDKDKLKKNINNYIAPHFGLIKG